MPDAAVRRTSTAETMGKRRKGDEPNDPSSVSAGGGGRHVMAAVATSFAVHVNTVTIYCSERITQRRRSRSCTT